MCIHNCRRRLSYFRMCFFIEVRCYFYKFYIKVEGRLQSAHTLKLKELFLNGVKMFVPMSYGQTTLSHALRPEPVLNIPETC